MKLVYNMLRIQKLAMTCIYDYKKKFINNVAQKQQKIKRSLKKNFVKNYMCCEILAKHSLEFQGTNEKL